MRVLLLIIMVFSLSLMYGQEPVSAPASSLDNQSELLLAEKKFAEAQLVVKEKAAAASVLEQQMKAAREELKRMQNDVSSKESLYRSAKDELKYAKQHE